MLEEFVEKIKKFDVDSLLELADKYYDGEEIERDFEKAFYCYKEAAKKNCALAYNFIGQMYQDGYGTEKDYSKAVDNFKKAISLGDKSAKGNLGYLYLNGLDVRKDYFKAF